MPSHGPTASGKCLRNRSGDSRSEIWRKCVDSAVSWQSVQGCGGMSFNHHLDELAVFDGGNGTIIPQSSHLGKCRPDITLTSLPWASRSLGSPNLLVSSPGSRPLVPLAAHDIQKHVRLSITVSKHPAKYMSATLRYPTHQRQNVCPDP